jgi:hypothetical protein
MNRSFQDFVPQGVPLRQHAVFGRANRPGPQDAVPPLDVRFSLDAWAQADELAPNRDPTGKRKYRRTRTSLGPRTYRTRGDPFEADWQEITGWLAVQPERTAKSLFEELQERTGAKYSAGQLRTLQRRVKEWRAHALLVFDEQWLAEAALDGATTTVLHHELRAMATAG